VHTRSPLPVHDFIHALQALPLSVARAMYQEGGPEATLYVNAGGFELERLGSFNLAAWPLPNVFGTRPRR
jgi:hypothetical protein